MEDSFIKKHFGKIKHRGSLFNILLIIILCFGIGLSVTNIIYYSKLITYPSESISSSSARVMTSLNSLFLVITFLSFFYFLYILFTSEEAKFKNMKKVYNSVKGDYMTMNNSMKVDNTLNMDPNVNSPVLSFDL